MGNKQLYSRYTRISVNGGDDSHLDQTGSQTSEVEFPPLLRSSTNVKWASATNADVKWAKLFNQP